jgi:hypothetical protein
MLYDFLSKRKENENKKPPTCMSNDTKKSSGGGGRTVTDPRFAHVHTDARFRVRAIIAKKADRPRWN